MGIHGIEVLKGDPDWDGSTLNLKGNLNIQMGDLAPIETWEDVINSWEVTTHTVNGVMRFSKLDDAIGYATDIEPDVWKISFTLPSGELVRLIRDEDRPLFWVFNPNLAEDV